MGSYRPHEEMGVREKRFVEAVVDFLPDGTMRPLSIVWDTGVTYGIERVLDARQALSVKTGDTGVRYTILVNGQRTYLWFDGKRWFVEAKHVEMPDSR